MTKYLHPLETKLAREGHLLQASMSFINAALENEVRRPFIVNINTHLDLMLLDELRDAICWAGLHYFWYSSAGDDYRYLTEDIDGQTKAKTAQ